MKANRFHIFGHNYLSIGFWALVVLISRIPFLNAGYGVEEDSWGIAVAAYHTQLYGVMEASRLPGHPVNEFIYALFWGYGPWLYNFFSALCSVVSFIFFYLIGKKLSIKQPVLAALALVFTPVIYINSTCTVDYLWALMFVLISFYLLISKKYYTAAVFFALAVGCRINSIILYIPFVLWILFTEEQNTKWKKIIVFSILSGLVSVLCYVPIIYVYGSGFFTYSDQFPYPNAAKIFYKATIGVFGLPAFICMAFILPFARNKVGHGFKPINILFLSLLIIQTWSYLMLPQKSAYLMLIVPFFILWGACSLNNMHFIILLVSLIISSFCFSINLTDPYRGSQHSKYALKTKVAGQEMFLDFFSGPMINDYTKRINKMNYTARVIEKARTINYPAVIISGWWFNQILIQQMENPIEGRVKFAFYLNPEIIETYVKKGYIIYYLAEQDLYNDLYFKIHRTKMMSEPFLF